MSKWLDPTEIQSVIDEIKALKVEKNLNVKGPEEFAQNILKYDSITLQPSAGIQFNDETAAFNAIVTRKLQIKDVDQEILIGLAPNDKIIDGASGTPGSNGSPSHNVNDHSGAETGGHASDGGPGTPGQTLHRSPLFLFVEEIHDLNGPLSSNLAKRLPVVISARGIEGGSGGIGGNGGTGGNGRGGRHGVSSLFDCKSGPQAGGAGGNGGRGGRGGDAAQGGNGADVFLVGQDDFPEAASWWLIDTRGGMPGEPGRGGPEGRGGQGGDGGGPRGHCHGNGAKGATGIVPSPISLGSGSESSIYGSRGEVSLVSFDVASLFN